MVVGNMSPDFKPALVKPGRLVAKVDRRMALVDALETRLVTELTGTPSSDKVSVPSARSIGRGI